MEHVLTVNVVTPDGLVYDHHATMVVAHTADGEVGLMANHAPIVMPLSIDVVRVKRTDDPGHEDWIAVNGGMLEMRDNLVSIISDAAERERNIDLPRAERAKLRAEKAAERAKESHDIDEYRRAEVALQRAVNRIRVSRHGQ